MNIRVGRGFKVNWPTTFIESEDNPGAYVYEVLDRHERIVYVGITGDFAARWSSHLRQSWWATSVDICRVRLSGWRSRSDARKIEALTIAQFSPPCNTKPERKYLRLAQADRRLAEVLFVADLRPTREF